MKDLNRRKGVTVMITSHDIELEHLAGRIVMIDRGRIAFDGDFGALRRRFGDRRHLVLETADTAPPQLAGVGQKITFDARDRWRSCSGGRADHDPPDAPFPDR